ncbi:DNA translocase SpoIIIE [Tenuibacillus multivorans]|uniref:DNA segregation ATPase FtsK/SpoIIIE, S-DNA-T family n=2 Tax=Tenuibacillus multivorans TaxID=237069 RepID=A0A1G9XU91_9BACI|nr:DNA translocase SpoIIIE [Tenuibacillus multivorans]SDN00354.1 DNA segregation ATPase FtsK/SpoIIIE, S-DNA-T family [Tenuibacillus multivorans]
MAKRKKKKQTKRKKRNVLQFELIGLVLILFAIFSSGISTIGEGVIPHVFTTLFKWLFGFWYIAVSLFLLILGIYLMTKRKWPEFSAPRWIGFYIMFAAVLLFTHVQSFEPIINQIPHQNIFGLTWDYFEAYQEGQVSYGYIGAGMAGALLFASSYYLLSAAGAKVLAVFGVLIGFMLLTEQSISDLFKKVFKRLGAVFQKASTNRKEKKQAKQEAKEQDEKLETTYSIENDEIKPTESQPVIEDFQQYVENDGQQELETKQWTEQLKQEDNEQSSEEMEDLPLTEVENESYKLPSIQLLKNPVAHSQQHEKSQIQSTVNKLERTFHSFGVKAKVTKVHVGPAVTKYEVYPDVGVKVSKIVNLHDDLALALAAKDIRIEAPIPGKSAIGIEVPNTEVAQVSLREVVQNAQNHPSKLLFGLGRDIAGEAVTSELNKMPHLLIAGATGSGKSVCVNGIITSILLRAKPHEVKMMMIDPKKVELNVYNGIPHLLAPVVTDPKKASQALKKIVSEMERRYDLFSETGTRNIEGYNEYVDKINEQEDENHPHLPYVVVLIDELADLMMVASNEVEDSITRLAQMARAAGIHLIIATQRPSVDVITGVIKANIPSRIAFSVSSQTDSRTILDGGGAEKLLGKGDMLFIPVGASKPTRIQGAFLSDAEVERIVDFCIEQQKAQYQEDMIPDETNEVVNDVDDDLYEDAVHLIVEMQSASVSMLQRKFRVGYTRAARLIDAMEERGIVGPYEGSKPRKVLVSNYQQEEQTTTSS